MTYKFRRGKSDLRMKAKKAAEAAAKLETTQPLNHGINLGYQENPLPYLKPFKLPKRPDLITTRQTQYWMSRLRVLEKHGDVEQKLTANLAVLHPDYREIFFINEWIREQLLEAGFSEANIKSQFWNLNDEGVDAWEVAQRLAKELVEEAKGAVQQ